MENKVTHTYKKWTGAINFQMKYTYIILITT